jgi:hypothetical protein
MLDLRRRIGDSLEKINEVTSAIIAVLPSTLISLTRRSISATDTWNGVNPIVFVRQFPVCLMGKELIVN